MRQKETLGLVAFGEPLVELRRHGSQLLAGLGGDALNVAARARQLGITTGLVAGFGQDALSSWLEAEIGGLGVEVCSLGSGGTTGIYGIDVADDGQRTFSYWRSDSPMLAVDMGCVVDVAAGASAVFLSGITQSLSTSCQAATSALASSVSDETMVAFDPNFRAPMWAPRGGLQAAREAADELLPLTDLLVPSIEDCRALWGHEDAFVAASRLSRVVPTVVVKDGENGVVVGVDGRSHRFRAPTVNVVDTTGAGDAFTGSFMALLSTGTGLDEAIERAVGVASRSVMTHGALSDLADTPMEARTSAERGSDGQATAPRAEEP